MPRFRAVIPARYASSRLPGKVLLSISGKPMLQWVYERARASEAAEVLIATDDLLVVSAAHSFGAETVMTQAAHQSGSDRIAEVASRIEAAIYLNVQGDQPFIAPEDLDALVAPMRAEAATTALGWMAVARSSPLAVANRAAVTRA